MLLEYGNATDVSTGHRVSSDLDECEDWTWWNSVGEPGVQRPTCGCSDVRYLANQRRWECKAEHAKKQFSVKVGTIFEDSAGSAQVAVARNVDGVDDWKNGVSSYEIARRAIGVYRKSAWFHASSHSIGKVQTNDGENF